jgi:hypothetical protein
MVQEQTCCFGVTLRSGIAPTGMDVAGIRFGENINDLDITNSDSELALCTIFVSD